MLHTLPVEAISMTLNDSFKILGFVAVTMGLSGCGKPGYCTDVDEYAKKMKIERSVAEKHINLLSIGTSRNSGICRDEISRTDFRNRVTRPTQQAGSGFFWTIQSRV